eukprot:TRINITY_DN6112_c0_g1_i2.p1 TRINITY_DN6112_c0_g1~~TRINITY_DN6112_c0_g1_i2.p1  ORF type:complete len:297 (+),score=85.74 TRINITY_DN6112_c0_g1_i2:98-988(+)
MGDNILEIAKRDAIIHEKEKKIYELKKRTQELEKFKTVLDYKIKEFKKEIGPREEIIQTMKDETNKMDKKLKKLSGINNTLGLVVDELDDTLEEMQKKITEQRLVFSSQVHKIKRFKDAVYNAVQFIQDPEALVLRIEEIYNDPSIHKDVRTNDIEPEIYAEYISQKKYLEKSVAMLKQNLTKDNEIHKQDNIRIMRENVELIKEINKLRTEIRKIKFSQKGDEGGVTPGMRGSKFTPAKKRSDSVNLNSQDRSNLELNSMGDIGMTVQEKKKLADQQRLTMADLQARIAELENLL